MTRQEIIKKFIDATALKLAKIKFSIEDAQETANKAPGPMQSASDTTKAEMNLLISGFIKEQERLSDLLKALYSLTENSAAANSVSVGTLVKIENNNKKALYFIMKDSGGIEIKTGADTISGLSPEAPMAEQLMGRGVGDSITFSGQTVKVVEIL